MALLSLSEQILPMLTPNEVLQRMLSTGGYDRQIMSAPYATRMQALYQINEAFYPLISATDIYSTLYLKLYDSLRTKDEYDPYEYMYQSYKKRKKQPSPGIIKPGVSESIIGVTGIGKTTMVGKSLELITGNNIFDWRNGKFIPYIKVETPKNGTVRSLLIEILQEIERSMQRKIFTASSTHISSDLLTNQVCAVASAYVGIVILDEIQNIKSTSNKETDMLRTLVQLVNSGVSIVVLGTDFMTSSIKDEPQIARRFNGITIDSLPFDSFSKLGEFMFSMQYTKVFMPYTEQMNIWLYNHSNGIPGILSKLIYTANKIAIERDIDKLSLRVFEKAYESNMNTIEQAFSKKDFEIKKYRKKEKAVLPYSNMQSITQENIEELILCYRKNPVKLISILTQKELLQEIEVIYHV